MRKNETTKCLSLCWVSFLSKVKYINPLAHIVTSLCFQTDLQYRLSAYKSPKPWSPLGLLSFCSWKRETMHKRGEITSFCQHLTFVTCNHFHISVTELRHFLYTFYLRASKCTNQPIPGNSAEASLTSALQRGVTRSYKLFPPSRDGQNPGILFPHSFLLISSAPSNL